MLDKLDVKMLKEEMVEFGITMSVESYAKFRGMSKGDLIMTLEAVINESHYTQADGHKDGYELGRSVGHKDGYDEGRAVGYTEGYTAGHKVGYTKACNKSRRFYA
jgi:hypothetical protein